MGSARPGPEALAGISTLRALAGTLFYALPDLGTGVNPNWADDRVPASGAAARVERERPLRVRRPERRRRGRRGRRLHRRLRRRRRRDRRRARSRGQVGRACSRRATTSTTRDFDGSSSTPTSARTSAAGRSRPSRARSSIVAGTGVGGGTVVNWTNCLRTYDHVRAEWASRARAQRPRRVRLRPPPRRGLRAARGQRRVQRPERPAPADAGGRASGSATTSA